MRSLGKDEEKCLSQSFWLWIISVNVLGRDSKSNCRCVCSWSGHIERETTCRVLFLPFFHERTYNSYMIFISALIFLFSLRDSTKSTWTAAVAAVFSVGFPLNRLPHVFSIKIYSLLSFFPLSTCRLRWKRQMNLTFLEERLFEWTSDCSFSHSRSLFLSGAQIDFPVSR
jgi:hypothetical protein